MDIEVISKKDESTDRENVKPAFAAISRFTIINGMEKEVKEAFINRPHLVDSAEGFSKMEVISPLDNPSEIWLMTWWETEEAYRKWHKSHLYRDSHHGIPKGLKLDPQKTSITFFEHICS